MTNEVKKMARIIETWVAITFWILFNINYTTEFVLPTKHEDTTALPQSIRPMILRLGGSIDQIEAYLESNNFTAEQIGSCLQNSTLVAIQQTLNNTSTRNKTTSIITALAELSNITRSIMNSLYYPCSMKRYLSVETHFTSNLNFLLQYALNATHMAEPEVSNGMICREPSGCILAQLLAIMREFGKIFQLIYELI